ncbi:MAG: hypothetical protein M0026_08225 [Nocardiopsaceae bacterium]|nr:hypothetical protein [Nocardiopsaceae bacterium]
MSPSESSVAGSAGRRRKTDEADSIAGLDASPSRRKGARRRRRSGRSGAGGKGRGKALPLLLGALGLAVVALVAVLVVRFMAGGDAAPANAAPAVYGIYDSENISEVLSSQEQDSRALAEGELFERGNEEIESQGITFTLAASSLSEDCAAAVWGEAVQKALADAGCTQAARAGYTSGDHVGLAAMFNLRDTEAAQAVAEALQPPKDPEAEAPGFVTVPTEEAPFDKLGAGYSAAEATVSGHYLVVTWVQSVDSTDPAEKESLTSPLIALGGFQDPLYRRVVQYEETQGTDDAGTQPEAGAPEGTDTGGATETGEGVADPAADPASEAQPAG